MEKKIRVVKEEGSNRFSNAQIQKEIIKMIKNGKRFIEIGDYIIRYFPGVAYDVFEWHSTWSGPAPMRRKKGK